MQIEQRENFHMKYPWLKFQNIPELFRPPPPRTAARKRWTPMQHHNLRSYSELYVCLEDIDINDISKKYL